MCKKLKIEVEEDMNKLAFHKYIEKFENYAMLNQYIDEHKPWSLKESNLERMNIILYILAEIIVRLLF